MINASINRFLILVPAVAVGRRQDEQQRYSRYTGLVWNRLRRKTPPPSCTGDRCLSVHIQAVHSIYCNKKILTEFASMPLHTWKRISYRDTVLLLNFWCNIGWAFSGGVAQPANFSSRIHH